MLQLGRLFSVSHFDENISLSFRQGYESASTSQLCLYAGNCTSNARSQRPCSSLYGTDNSYRSYVDRAIVKRHQDEVSAWHYFNILDRCRIVMRIHFSENSGFNSVLPPFLIDNRLLHYSISHFCGRDGLLLRWMEPQAITRVTICPNGGFVYPVPKGFTSLMRFKK